MNCTHCRQLIEAGPLPELAPARIDAIEHHVAGCPDCRQALAAARRIERTLAELPDPVVPDGLEASIMRRVFEREADQALATTTPAATLRRPLSNIVFGAVLAIGAELVGLLSGWLPVPSTEVLWQAGTQTLASVPHSNLGMLVLAIGLLLMLSGLTQATDTGTVAGHDKQG